MGLFGLEHITRGGRSTVSDEDLLSLFECDLEFSIFDVSSVAHIKSKPDLYLARFATGAIVPVSLQEFLYIVYGNGRSTFVGDDIHSVFYKDKNHTADVWFFTDDAERERLRETFKRDMSTPLFLVEVWNIPHAFYQIRYSNGTSTSNIEGEQEAYQVFSARVKSLKDAVGCNAVALFRDDECLEIVFDKKKRA